MPLYVMMSEFIYEKGARIRHALPSTGGRFLSIWSFLFCFWFDVVFLKISIIRTLTIIEKKNRKTVEVMKSICMNL